MDSVERTPTEETKVGLLGPDELGSSMRGRGPKMTTTNDEDDLMCMGL